MYRRVYTDGLLASKDESEDEIEDENVFEY